LPPEGSPVLNVASGTGRDTFEIARRADHVVGLEPSASMRAFAAQKRRVLGIDSVHFVAGVAEKLPFRQDESGCALSIHGAPFFGRWEQWSIREWLRVVRPNGWVAFVSSPEPSHLGSVTNRTDRTGSYGSAAHVLARPTQGQAAGPRPPVLRINLFTIRAVRKDMVNPRIGRIGRVVRIA